MPLGFGRESRPLEARHCARLELRGPCVDIRFAVGSGTDCESMVILSMTGMR